VTRLSACFMGFMAVTALGIWILAPLVALRLPLHLVAQWLLQRALRRAGVSRLISRACMVEIADGASRSQARLAETMNWSLLLAKDRILTEIDRDAGAISDWLNGASAAGPEYLIAALRKHGVPFGLMASGKGSTSNGQLE
jgi:hypothetical protein